jgi:hypothetical protein
MFRNWKDYLAAALIVVPLLSWLLVFHPVACAVVLVIVATVAVFAAAEYFCPGITWFVWLAFEIFG